MLYVVRHGRTAPNAAGLLLGRADPPLDAVGEAQALALAAALPSVARVVSSPLARARSTAAAFGLPVEIDERWIELDYGTLDETPLASTPAALWTAWRADPSFVPAPGAESLVVLGRRVTAACESLAEAAAESEVVVVTHVSPVKAAVAWALAVGESVAWRMYVAPASITRIAVRGDGTPVVHSFNETAHLHELPTGS